MMSLDPEPQRHALAHKFRFFVVEGSTDEDGHLDDTGDDLCCTDSFDTVEQFWHVYDHLVRAGDLPPNTDLCLFRDGIKPDIEEDANVGGGRWTVKLRKGLASRMFEALILAAVGRAYGLDDDMCGVVVSSRAEEDILSVWNSHKDREGTLRLQRAIIAILSLPPSTALEYKRHSNYKPPDGRLQYSVATLKDLGASVSAAVEKGYNIVPAYLWENQESFLAVRMAPGGAGGDDAGGGWESVGSPSGAGSSAGEFGGMGRGGYVRGGGRGGFRGGGRGAEGMGRGGARAGDARENLSLWD